MWYKKNTLIIGGFVVLAGLGFVSFSLIKNSGSDPSDVITNRLSEWHQKYPQEKVYLHLDKQTYNVGDNIWFKVYFMDGKTHEPSIHSNVLIVELVNSFGKTSMTRLLKLKDGFAFGDFAVQDTVPAGLYEIRAYTSWMRNFEDEYFFRHQIEILNPEFSEQLYRQDRLANKRLKKKSIRKSEKLDIQFFPESGDLVNGLETRVAFKAVNMLGQGIDIAGEILDEKDNRVAEFKSFHDGMGAFSLKPLAGEKYMAVVSAGEENIKIPLPEPLKSGFVMTVDNKDRENITVNIRSTYNDPGVFLVGQTRGQVFYNRSFTLKSGSFETKIPLNLFPTGIMQLTLFDHSSVPHCERLVFVNHNDALNIALEPEKNSYGSREKIVLKMTARNARNRPVDGNFSLSVTESLSNANKGDFYSGIVSYLLLSSDLKGRIQNPDYYFKDDHSETREALDYLLMTQGWRRFSWENVIGEVPLEIEYFVEKGLSVEGKVTRELFGIPLKFLPVTLTVLSGYNDVFETRTNDKGRFLFNLPDYEDTLDIEITSTRLSGKKNLVIYIDATELPERDLLLTSYSKEMAITGTNIFRPVPEEEPDPNQPVLKGIHGDPDNVIYVDEKLASYNNVFDIIKGRVPGVMVTGNQVQIRGPNSFLLSTEPLYLIDDVPVDANAISTLNPQDVERIEVLKGPSAAIYGSRGANGVIAVYTKRGKFMKKGILESQILGFYRPKEFYSPKYETRFDFMKPDERTTLFWAPTITLDSIGQAEVVFYSSDVKGSFDVTVQGVSYDGKIGESISSIEIE